MTSVDVTFGVIFFLQIAIGTLGNVSLLYHYFVLYVSGHQCRLTDVILGHLTVVNSVVILSRGIPETMQAFGLKHFLNDIGCKLVFYAHRVGRGVSMGSIVQALSISPRSSRWAELRVRAQKYIGLSNSFCWVLHMVLNISVLVFVSDKWNNTNILKSVSFQYRLAVLPSRGTHSGFSTFTFLHDISCLTVMIWASGSRVFILYKHEQRVHQIRGHSISSRPSPVIRASQNILILLSSFIAIFLLKGKKRFKSQPTEFERSLRATLLTEH